MRYWTGWLALALCSHAAAATVFDLDFIAGDWRGEDKGEQIEEVWTTPDHGGMTGMFRSLKNGEPTFYEFMTIESRPEGPTLLIKHFEPGLKGWEEKDKAITCPLKSFQPYEATFESVDEQQPTRLTFRRTGKKTLEVILERQRNEQWTKGLYRYTRAK